MITSENVSHNVSNSLFLNYDSVNFCHTYTFADLVCVSKLWASSHWHKEHSCAKYSPQWLSPVLPHDGPTLPVWSDQYIFDIFHNQAGIMINVAPLRSQLSAGFNWECANTEKHKEVSLVYLISSILDYLEREYLYRPQKNTILSSDTIYIYVLHPLNVISIWIMNLFFTSTSNLKFSF